MTIDLGVECVVGLCVAAVIMWIARRRRVHAEGPKTRLDSLDPTALKELHSAAARQNDSEPCPQEGNEERGQKDSSGSEHSTQDLAHEPLETEDEEEEWELEEGEDDNDEDGSDEEAEDEDEGDEGELVEEEGGEDKDEVGEAEVGKGGQESAEAEQKAMALAAAMASQGFSMTESFVAMQEFHVVGAAPVPELAEEERMRMEDPSRVRSEGGDGEPQPSEEETEDATSEGERSAGILDDDDEEEESREEPVEEEASSAMAAFWAKCENKEECNLCRMPFSFLARRHHCRKCCASVCAGCSSNSAAMPEFGGNLVRVCDRCWPIFPQVETADDGH